VSSDVRKRQEQNLPKLASLWLLLVRLHKVTFGHNWFQWKCWHLPCI